MSEYRRHDRKNTQLNEENSNKEYSQNEVDAIVFDRYYRRDKDIFDFNGILVPYIPHVYSGVTWSVYMQYI